MIYDIRTKTKNSGHLTNSFLFLILIFLFLVPVFKANAQTQAGISVTPSIAHLDLALDAPTYELIYKNNTNSSITLNLSVKDFTELEDSYKMSFLEGKEAANYKYSLSSWVSFENKTLNLSPNEIRSVKVFIDKDRITKGGHYASILAEIVSPQQEKQINVKAVLSSLLFVRAATGKEIEEGSINTFTPLRDSLEYPESYILRFENSGNVHVVPYGLIQILDPFGNLAAKGIFNQDSLDALPESIRRYDTKVTTYQKVLMPGIYTAKINMHFGKTDQKLSSSVKFFSQGSFDFVKIGFTLLILVFILIYIRRRKKQLVNT